MDNITDATPLNATNGYNLSHSNESNHATGSHGHHEQPPYHILFIFGSCGVGAVLRILLRKWANFVSRWKWGSLMKLPYTVFLLIIGMIVAAIGMQFPSEVQPYLLSRMDPELFLHVFLPVVIFESAYVIDIHVFWRSIGHVSMLAVPGLLLATILTATLSLVIPDIGNIVNWEAKIYVALIFGAIISATDPVAVVALLKELGNQKYLGTIIEGEALLNDGAAIVVFKIFLEMLKSMTPYFASQTALTTFQLVMQQSLLGPVIGWLLARIGSFILLQIYNDALAEITVTLSFTYITFYVGEVCETSGVLAVVTFGLALDRASITPQVDHFLHRFWEMLAYLANTLIFVIVGITITNHMEQITIYDVGYLLIIYIGITFIRGLSIFCFFPAMKRLGIELSWRHVLVMTWGGLRGAVGLALAIYLNSYVSVLSPLGSEDYGNYDVNSTLHNPVADIDFEKIFQKILIHTGGIVVLTLIINASTIEAALKKLGMLDITEAQQLTMRNAVNRIQSDLKRSLGVLKYDRFLADAKWSMVEEMTVVDYPYKNATNVDSVMSTEEEYKHLTAVQISSQDDHYKDLFEEARLRMIKALKMSYGKQYSNGMLTDQEARVLISAADTAADKPGAFVNVETISKNWKVTGFLPYAKAKLEDWMYSKKNTDLKPPRNRQLRKIYRLVISNKFEIIMQCIVILNIIPISLDFVVDETWADVEKWWLWLQITNMVFIAIYVAEVVLKVLGLGKKQYIRSRWNQFDLLILAFCFIEIIIDFSLVDSAPGSGSIAKTVRTTKVIKFGKVTKAIRTLRATRLLRLSKTIMPKTVDFINRLINKQLSFGYNVGKGFVTGEEEVNKLIVSISENRKVQVKLIEASDRNRLLVTREMGLLQRDHPGIAISVKTRNAVRTILNHSRDTIHQLCAGGVLDETETQLLERGVDIRQKRLSAFPSTVAPLPPEDLLENIFWIRDDEKLLEFVKEHATCMDYDYGDVIMEEDDEADGIHIIVYGMIKLFGSLHGHIQHLNLTSAFSSKVPRITNGDDESSEDGGLEQEDFLGSGNIIGEIGLLTGGKRTCTVTCETAVQTYFLSCEDMVSAFEKFQDLKNKMWKVVAVRIGAPLYLEHLEYQAFGVEQIHLHLSKGYIEVLSEKHTTFFFTDTIMEVSVIHGCVATPMPRQQIIKAPELLQPEYEEIRVHDCDFAILLVIPRETLTLDSVPSTIGLGHHRASRLPSISRFPAVNATSRKVSKITPIEEVEEFDEM
uniref:Sodium/hydrogen exchanger 10-like n=1 Tax=Phallusia mammillata TaxID=59560 RepID=A0A6F9DSC6_9ASCI|nr:sodium/hydrogen exchanger 10-like [Phallusia mammillata]